jgi:NADPH-dependent glutamate synthase beta subunit-like oxidoreductase
VILAMRDGKQAAAAINAYLNEQSELASQAAS